MSISRSVLFVLSMALPVVPSVVHLNSTAAAAVAEPESRSAFIEEVRRDTAIFRDVGNAAPDYQPALGCVSGPEAGAMGVHFVNGTLLLDDTVTIDKPEALIYEFKDNIARLVGVEYIVFYDNWHKTHDPNDPPVLNGQLLHLVESPNRFGLPRHYELHAWAWRDNPNGTFVDWNPRVSCDEK